MPPLAALKSHLCTVPVSASHLAAATFAARQTPLRRQQLADPEGAGGVQLTLVVISELVSTAASDMVGTPVILCSGLKKKKREF